MTDAQVIITTVPGPATVITESGPRGLPGVAGADTGEEILAKLASVDGHGSGLDADTLDGNHATAFDAAGAADTAVSTHVADSDPHTQYHTDTRGDARYSQLGHTHAYDDLAGLPTLGTAAIEDTGTSAGNLVQLDGSARLPPVDGSQLTNLPSSGGITTFARGASWPNKDGVSLPTNDVEIFIPTSATIVGVYINTNGGTGSCVVDIKKSAASICGSTKPTISGGTSYSDTALTGWATSISAGDVLTLILESVSGAFEFISIAIVLN